MTDTCRHCGQPTCPPWCITVAAPSAASLNERGDPIWDDDDLTEEEAALVDAFRQGLRDELAREARHCGAFIPTTPPLLPYRCTRPYGHDGNHEAVIDGVVVAEWRRKESP